MGVIVTVNAGGTEVAIGTENVTGTETDEVVQEIVEAIAVAVSTVAEGSTHGIGHPPTEAAEVDPAVDEAIIEILVRAVVAEEGTAVTLVAVVQQTTISAVAQAVNITGAGAEAVEVNELPSQVEVLALELALTMTAIPSHPVHLQPSTLNATKKLLVLDPENVALLVLTELTTHLQNEV